MRRHLPADIADRPGLLTACLVFGIIWLICWPLVLLGDLASRPLEWAAQRVMQRLGYPE